MKQLNKFNIDEIASVGTTKEQIRLFLSENSEGFIFQKVIERARHYSDLAIYYLEASYICEEIAALGKASSFEINWASGYHPVAQFIFIPDQLTNLQNLIYKLALSLAGEYDDDYWWMENLEEYKENIQKRKLKFPGLADDYFANLINGAYGEYESNYDNHEEFRALISKQNPEHLFGFWKCMYSDQINEVFYVSSECWIIPPQSDLNAILKNYSSVDRLNLEKADIFSLNGSYYIFNENYILSLSFPALAKAFQCISHVFNEETSFYDQYNWLNQLSSANNVKISDFAGFLFFALNDYQIILWDPQRLSFNEINSLNRSVSKIFQNTSILIGLKESIFCEWSQLDDELFEGLCYDLIYYDPRFDNKTIRKMGKSRSRDGGRDIVVYSKDRVGYKPEKFIFQCKLLKNDRSLTAAKVQDISDIIEQYDADGYGIYTSGIIDSTLFDKVDKISNRKKVKTILSSRYELERYLSMLPQIKARYFKNLING